MSKFNAKQWSLIDNDARKVVRGCLIVHKPKKAVGKMPLSQQQVEFFLEKNPTWLAAQLPSA